VSRQHEFRQKRRSVSDITLRCKWIPTTDLYIFVSISVKFAAEDLDVILHNNVWFRKILYIEDCKKVSNAGVL
jgi:hypothetical protein